MKSTLKRWLPFAFISVVFAAVSYLGIQQLMRQDANDPQVQLSEDVATAMDAGATSADIIPQTSVDMSKSLSPFVLIYDKNNKLSGADVVIGTKKPEVPAGVLDEARSSGSNRVTWEPESGVRAALVAMKDKNGNIVVVGRSLREVESRDQQMMILFGGALAVALIGSFMMLWVMDGGMKSRPKAAKVAAAEVAAPAHDVPTHEHHDHADHHHETPVTPPQA